MNHNTLALAVALPNVAFIVDLEALYEKFCQLSDQRHRRGIRYPLPVLALIALLAKFAGQDSFQAIADWAKAHQVELAQLLDLKRVAMPHPATFCRVLGDKFECSELEKVISDHFKGQLSQEIPSRGSLTLSIDGKTLRGTIPAGAKQGVHLMAAYLPQKGIVLARVAVGTKTNEITAAPRLLKMVDLRGVVVTGDAMQAQKELSVQVVSDGGDYLWLVKANQAGLLGAIEQLFEPLEWGVGFSQPSLEIEQATRYDQGHGRVEKRTIWVSSELAEYSYWPHLRQVFKLEREWVELATDEQKREVRYGISSLSREVAGPERLMEIAREEWGIENCLHWVRDVTFREDESHLRRGHGPEVLAILNNVVLGTLRLALGSKCNIAKTRRQWGHTFSRALFQARLGAA
jgi:predicted transposase YbfD/YdcC